MIAGGLASPHSLRAATEVHARRGRPGVPALRAVLDDWVLDSKPVDSILEPMMRRVLDRFGLPPAQFHAVVAGYEVDFHFLGTPVVLECDGWETHGMNRRQFEFDRERNAHVTPPATSSSTSLTGNSTRQPPMSPSGSAPTSPVGPLTSSRVNAHLGKM